MLAAFGIDATPSAIEPLTGGRGLTWRAGGRVLRPSVGDDETVWKAETLRVLPHGDGFRAPRPILSVTGQWTVAGWEAWEWLPGATDESRVADVIRAGRAFHAALASLPRPDFLDAPTDPWACADQMAWEELALPDSEVLQRLAAAFAPVRASSQLVHGDLLGNVMFDEAGPPAVIDWAPYWRPVSYAEAIVLIDAVCWNDHPIASLSEWATGEPEGRQMLVRALTFRIATLHLLGAWDGGLARRHAPTLDAVLA